MPQTWHEPAHVSISPELMAQVGGHRVVAETLVRRGFITLDQVQAFLDPTVYTPASPDVLPDMAKAVERLRSAIQNNEQISVWGDFDVDGQTATSLLVSALRPLGAQISYHIPNRQTEGHGIAIPFLQTELDKGARVLLTCDTGIAAHDAVDYAQARGVDVIITDHHHLTETLPNAFAVINPKRLPDGHPLRELPGVGCAYKLIEALYQRFGRPTSETDKLLDLVALGIVADVAVQTGDTRYLLQRGLEVLRNTTRTGLLEMMRLAELNPALATETHIAFTIAPRMNALGRLADANPAVELLTTSDTERARILALELEGLNNERRLLTEQVYNAAQAQLEQTPALLEDAALVLAHPGWPTGVIGIVANKLVEAYHRPVLMLSLTPEGIARGSARSVTGCDITAAIAEHADLLIGYGGHTMAAGLSMQADALPRFRRALSRTVKRMLDDAKVEPALEISSFIDFDEISLDLVAQIERLAPFGAGNPPLVLAAHGVQVESTRPIGRDQQHRVVTVRDADGDPLRLVWWDGGPEEPPTGRFDVAFVVRATTYKGEARVEAEWRDSRQSAEEARAANQRLAVVDYRDSHSGTDLRELLTNNHDVAVWVESDKPENITGYPRHKLTPAPALVVWTIPPGAAELHAVIEQVGPQTVYFCANLPRYDALEAFRDRLAGMVQFALNKQDGRADLRAMAAALSHREATVRAGLDWFAARGDVGYTEIEPGMVTFQRTIQPHGDSEQRQQRLNALLRETAAYREFYRRTAVEYLVQFE